MDDNDLHPGARWDDSADLTSSFVEQSSPAINPTPLRVGRYRIESVLGQGGFGRVYLARDEQLDRLVAVKVPHAWHLAHPEGAEPYLNEARIVANLDHPHIVPVHDVGSSIEYPCYIVSKYIEGSDLVSLIRQRKLSQQVACELVAQVAEALHYAHKQGLVHRDVKPGNILIDRSGSPYLVDFGMALKEENIGQGPKFTGTLAYMSPEQARGEGHRVDGRTDIYSLGAVLYELLTGRRKSTGQGRLEIQEQILEQDPKPLRQIDDTISRELERICLKALSRRATERYSTAMDFADDLWHFLGRKPDNIRHGDAAVTSQLSPRNTDPVASDRGLVGTDSQQVQIVPRGLRSFDGHDAEFFLHLLPGPRDRDGLPEIIRFWKSRIEQTDPEQTFSVGMIYGPSGCGKSSLVKAGLLPLLSKDVTSVYIETTPDETEVRLLNGLRKHCAGIGEKLDLKQSLTALRQGVTSSKSGKVLIILDQFEQWLHGNRYQENAELIQALRQCDGSRLQCIVLVRDDFWMAATRFMRDLEVPLREGVNSAAVDLFPIPHAEKVLTALGRAFGCLSDETRLATSEQREFVRQAVAMLATNGSVICVRLALFAEMIKGKVWSPQTLQEIGGAEGVGVAFLEETFSSPSAPLENRYHQKAAREILQALLPPSGTDIKGQMKSYDQLLAASGNAGRPADFDDLIGILDADLRLITPTDPEGLNSVSGSGSGLPVDQKYYQLSHDYLVQPIRDWLTRKQKETRRGRAELRLADYAATWNARPENRQLPTLWDYLGMRLLTRSRSWTPPERRMMRSATRVLGLRWGVVVLLLMLAGLFVNRYLASQREYLAKQEDKSRQVQAELLVKAVLAAPADAVPYAIENLAQYRSHAIPVLNEIWSDTRLDLMPRLRAAAVLAEFWDVRSQFLIDGIAMAPPAECATIIKALSQSPQDSQKGLLAAAQQARHKQNWPLQSRFGIVLLHLGDLSVAEEMLELRSDPTRRVQFIDTMRLWHGPLPPLVAIAERSNSGSLRSGIGLGIGGIPADRLAPAEVQAITPTLIRWYSNHSDSGTHSAAGWVLRQWNQPLPDLPTDNFPKADRDWYVNSVGMTLVRIPPKGADSKADTGNMRSLWLSDREVSRRLFQQFLDSPSSRVDPNPAGWKSADTTRSPTLDHPVQQVSWIDAALYCNWLSRKEGFVPCYRQNRTTWELDDVADGYRLPLEAEWELACRAGTTTPFVSGDESLLSLFAVYQSNHMQPCGSKLPNGWGLFDMHGNAYEWCQDFNGESNSIDKGASSTDTSRTTARAVRGGAYDYSARYARSFDRSRAEARYRSTTIGFRPARKL